jgi:hypothetical protein
MLLQRRDPPPPLAAGRTEAKHWSNSKLVKMVKHWPKLAEYWSNTAIAAQSRADITAAGRIQANHWSKFGQTPVRTGQALVR